MHNAAFAALGMDWRYVPLPVSTARPLQRIGEAVAGLRALGLAGANVTVPHKQAVMPHLDELTPAADGHRRGEHHHRRPRTGGCAATTPMRRGFIADLRDHGVDPRGGRCLVLGAGGSARAVVYGLAEAGAVEVTDCSIAPCPAPRNWPRAFQPAFADCRSGTLLRCLRDLPRRSAGRL